MHWVYILQSEKSGRFYVGHSEHPDQRLLEHNSGKVESTRSKGPWKRVRLEEYPTKSDAYQRELELKAWKSHARVAQLIDSKD